MSHDDEKPETTKATEAERDDYRERLRELATCVVEQCREQRLVAAVVEARPDPDTAPRVSVWAARDMFGHGLVCAEVAMHDWRSHDEQASDIAAMVRDAARSHDAVRKGRAWWARVGHGRYADTFLRKLAKAAARSDPATSIDARDIARDAWIAIMAGAIHPHTAAPSTGLDNLTPHLATLAAWWRDLPSQYQALMAGFTDGKTTLAFDAIASRDYATGGSEAMAQVFASPQAPELDRFLTVAAQLARRVAELRTTKGRDHLRALPFGDGLDNLDSAYQARLRELTGQRTITDEQAAHLYGSSIEQPPQTTIEVRVPCRDLGEATRTATALRYLGATVELDRSIPERLHLVVCHLPDRSRVVLQVRGHHTREADVAKLVEALQAATPATRDPLAAPIQLPPKPSTDGTARRHLIDYLPSKGDPLICARCGQHLDGRVRDPHCPGPKPPRCPHTIDPGTGPIGCVHELGHDGPHHAEGFSWTMTTRPTPVDVPITITVRNADEDPEP